MKRIPFAHRTGAPDVPTRSAGFRLAAPALMRATRYALAALALLTLVACGDEEKATEDIAPVVPTATPMALDEVPQGIEAVTLTVADGAFETDEVFGQQDEPTTLHLENTDDVDYRFRVSGGLVDAVDVPAGQEVDVSFTSPTSDEFTGELLAADEDTVVDEVRLVVQAAGGVTD